MKKIGKSLVYFMLATLLLGVLSPIFREDRVFADSASANYYVATNGNDAWTGTLLEPFRSVQKARDTVQAQIANGMTEDVTVWIHGGKYDFDSSLTFNENDSGRNGHEVIYRNVPGEEPVFNGGYTISNWSIYEGNIYKAEVGTGMKFNALYEDGVKSVKARYPNTGYSRIDGMFQGADVISKKFKFAAGDIPVVADPAGMQVYVWPGGPLGEWNWHANIIDVDSIDYAGKTAVLKENASYELGAGSRYYVQNRLEFLDQPGEFYLDEMKGILYYWPRAANIANVDITAPSVTRIVQFKGSSSSTPVTHIIFDGITIRNSDSFATTSGYITDGMVHMENAESITVKNSDLYNAGVYGISMEGHNENNLISGNRIHDTGISAIRIQGAWESSAYVSKKNTVRNNDIFRTGREVGHGAGIDLNETGENLVSHNRIHDSTRYAINFLSPRPGSIIGKTIEGTVVTRENARQFTHTENNIVEYNDLFKVNTDSQDTGVISAWGADTGNVIRNNRIHDSGVNFSFGFGIYLDDASDGFSVYNNIIDHMQLTNNVGHLSSVFMTKGVNNVVYNNIAANNNVFKASVETFELGDEPNRDLDYERNLFYKSGDTVYAFNNWAENRFAKTDNNVFFNAGGSYKVEGVPNVGNLEEWRAVLGNKYDQHSLIADPSFMHADTGDYRLRYSSPAYSVGFRDIDIENIGLEPDYRFADPNDPLDRVFVRKQTDAVNRGWMSISSGESTQLAVSGRSNGSYAADLSGALLTFASDKSSVATVSPEGVVTALGSGVAKITVIVELNGVTKSTDIDVLVGDAYESVELGAWKNTLLPLEKMPLQVSLHSQLGASLDPNDFSLTYQSSDSGIATVDAMTGIVTAIAPGVAVLKVTASHSGVEKTAEFQLHVASALLSQVHVTANKQIMRLTETGQLTFTANLSNGTLADLTNAQVLYESSNENVTTVEGKGVFHAVGAGKAELTVSITLDGVTKSGKIGVAVYPAESSLPIGWNVVNYGTTEGLASYANGQFTVASNGFDIWGLHDRFTYVYRSLPPSVVYERQTLMATIHSLDNTHADAASGIMFRDADSDDANNAILRILPGGGLRFTYRNAEHPDTWYMSGSTIAYPATLRLDKEGDVFTAYYKSGVNWVELGQVKVEMSQSILGGLALFSRAENPTPTESLVSDVSIVSEPVQLTGLQMAAAKSPILTGETTQLTVKGSGGIHGEYDVSGLKITYSSSNTGVASVNKAGLVTAVGQGTATVTATAKIGGKTIQGSVDIVVVGRDQINIALQKPVTVSSESWLGKSAITDGKLTSRNDSDMWAYWAADSKSPGEWLSIDLGGKQDIGKVKVQFPWMRGDWSGAPMYFGFVDIPVSITFQVSDDGINWRTIISKSTDVPVTRTEFSPDLYTYTIGAQGRYVRLLFEEGAQMSQFDSVGTAEVEVYQTAEPIDLVGDGEDPVDGGNHGDNHDGNKGGNHGDKGQGDGQSKP